MDDNIVTLTALFVLLVIANLLLINYYKKVRDKLREINDFITILDKAIEDSNITKEELDKIWAKFKDIVTSKQDK